MARPRPPGTVRGIHAPPARATLAGAFWLAAILSVPVAVLGLVVELALRLVL